MSNRDQLAAEIFVQQITRIEYPACKMTGQDVASFAYQMADVFIQKQKEVNDEHHSKP